MAEVSLVIPCYNQGPYLGRALESVLKQTFHEWEAIVVDDGSSDETSVVANEYDDPRVRYHYQDNRGLSGARNTGIQLARGNYLTFLDADDEWEPGFLSTCLAILKEVPDVPAVYTGCWFIDEAGRRLPQSSGDYSDVPDFRRRLLEGGFFPANAVVVRRDELERSGGFDESLSSAEDWDLWLSLSKNGRMIGTAERLARYRVYAGSMSTDADRMHANRLAVLAKHFGSPTSEVGEWPEEKRYAYGFAHRAAALAYLEEGRPERCWEELGQAADCWPDILERLDTYYEIGCGQQPKGYRGSPSTEEITRNGQAILQWIDNRNVNSAAGQQQHLRNARAQAFLALAMLFDKVGDWGSGRAHLRQAFLNDATLATRKTHVRRYLKMLAGKRIVTIMRGLSVGASRAAQHSMPEQ